MEHFIRCEVDFRVASAEGFGHRAQAWVLGAAGSLAADALAAAVADPALPRGPLTSGAPCGPAGAVWGFVSRLRRTGGGRERRTARVLDPLSAAWVAAGGRDGVDGLALALYRLDAEGYPGPLLLRAEAEVLPDAPGWARAWIEAPESRLLDAASQAGWLRFVREYAGGVDPSFGQISYRYGDDDATALEALAAPAWLTASQTIAESPKVLRGYDWLTICSSELTEELGGVSALRASNAFAEVEPLPSGGTWLLATRRYEDYGAAEIEAVWRALAPALRGGTPRDDMTDAYDAPFRVVFRDPAEA